MRFMVKKFLNSSCIETRHFSDSDFALGVGILLVSVALD